MSTTSLKLPPAVKASAGAAAKRRGITPHAFMVEAIAQAAHFAGQRAAFVAQANAARRSMLKSGVGFAADEVHVYLHKRLAGLTVKRPKARSWRA